MSPIQLVMLFMYWADLVLSVAAAAMLWLVLRGGMMSSMLLFELIAITIAMVFLTNVHPSVRRRL